MKSIMVSFVAGLLGGAIASIVTFGFITGRIGTHEIITIQRGVPPVQVDRFTVLDSGLRPSGYYVRYRNDEAVVSEHTVFAIRAFRDGKLWQEWQISDYHDVAPGAEREAILDPRLETGSELPDLSTYDVKVEVLYGFKKQGE